MPQYSSEQHGTSRWSSYLHKAEVDWISTLVAILALFPLIWFVKTSFEKMREMEQAAEVSAFNFMVKTQPRFLCIDANEEFHGVVADPALVCVEHEKLAGSLLRVPLTNLTFDDLVLFGEVAVDKCGIVDSWYSEEELSELYDPITSRRNTKRKSPPLELKGKPPNDDMINSIGDTLADKFSFYIKTPSPSHPKDVLRNLSRRNGEGINTVMGLLSGTLLFEKGLSSTWLRINQSRTTGKCLATNLKEFSWGLCAAEFYIVPLDPQAYACKDYVDNNSRFNSEQSQYEQAARANDRTYFFWTKMRYDSIQAFYTGALGALFGSVAIAAAMLVLACCVPLTKMCHERVLRSRPRQQWQRQYEAESLKHEREPGDP